MINLVLRDRAMNPGTGDRKLPDRFTLLSRQVPNRRKGPEQAGNPGVEAFAVPLLPFM